MAVIWLHLITALASIELGLVSLVLVKIIH